MKRRWHASSRLHLTVRTARHGRAAQDVHHPLGILDARQHRPGRFQLGVCPISAAGGPGHAPHSHADGSDDPIIPLVNARIMARLLPDATLHVYDDRHLGLVTEAHLLAPVVTHFLLS